MNGRRNRKQNRNLKILKYSMRMQTKGKENMMPRKKFKIRKVSKKK